MKYLSFVVVLLTVISCKKEEIPVPQSNEPVFTIEGTMGSESISLIAGDNNAYMFTNTYNENGVDVFSGNLSDGNTSIELGIYDGMLDLPSVNPAEFAFSTLNFSRNYSDTIVTLTKDIFANSQNIESIAWYINNAFADYDEAVIPEPGKYEVCALVTFTDFSQKNYCNDVIVGYDLKANARLKHSVDLAGQLKAWIQYYESDINRVRWYLDETFLTETEGKEPLKYSIEEELHVLKAVITFNNGVERVKSVIVDGASLDRDVEDLTNYEMGSYLQENRDFNVRLKINRNGIKYSSEECDNSVSVLNIIHAEYYGKNTNGNNVYKVSANINANVKNLNSGSVEPVQFNINFGLEIP